MSSVSGRELTNYYHFNVVRFCFDLKVLLLFFWMLAYLQNGLSLELLTKLFAKKKKQTEMSVEIVKMFEHWLTCFKWIFKFLSSWMLANWFNIQTMRYAIESSIYKWFNEPYNDLMLFYLLNSHFLIEPASCNYCDVNNNLFFKENAEKKTNRNTWKQINCIHSMCKLFSQSYFCDCVHFFCLLWFMHVFINIGVYQNRFEEINEVVVVVITLFQTSKRSIALIENASRCVKMIHWNKSIFDPAEPSSTLQVCTHLQQQKKSYHFYIESWWEISRISNEMFAQASFNDSTTNENKKLCVVLRLLIVVNVGQPLMRER